MDEAYTLRCEIKDLNRIFRRACQQVILLNNQIEAMKARYERAREANRRAFRYTNRLKLCAIEGIRNMYYEYACDKCDEIEERQSKLQTLTGSWDGAESSSEEEEENSSGVINRSSDESLNDSDNMQ